MKSPQYSIPTEAQNYMTLALNLAKRGLGRTEPNPMVGAVLVRNGAIVGKGYHRAAGHPHAEVEAIVSAGQKAEGADLYVTLEPCNHHGKTPPCSEAILKAGIKRVFFGMADPNPSVKGGGAQALAGAGLEVHGPILEERCRALNEVFLKNVNHSRPFVTLKMAMSLDGKIATRSGHSQWITSQESRLDGHRLRDRVSAIMIGVGTLLSDNPSLTTRLPNKKGRDPIRIVVDSQLRTPPDSNIFNRDSKARVIIACGKSPSPERAGLLEAQGATIIETRGGEKVDLDQLMDLLYEASITSLLIEGGATIAWAGLNAGLVDRCVFYYAPKIIGGAKAPTGVGGEGVDRLDEAILLEEIKMRRVGPDLRVTGRIRQPRD